MRFADVFWTNDNIGELIALIHSEVSEVLQAERTGEMDKHLPTRRFFLDLGHDRPDAAAFRPSPTFFIVC